MKIKFLGTAAYEGVPALFCVCDVCRAARKKGGRAMRTRSQAIIDDVLLIDFPADTLIHTMQHNVDLSRVHHCLITHDHSDHLYSEDIRMLERWYSKPPADYRISFYASEIAGEKIGKIVPETEGMMSLVNMKEFESVKADGYTITALPAIHAPVSGPLIYQITDGKKTMLYANDTALITEETFEFWKKTKPYFSLVSLDCTSGVVMALPRHHMGFLNNIEVKKRMIELGLADENTVFVSNHFSHNGKQVDYDEFREIAARENFVTSYDGLEIEF